MWHRPYKEKNGRTFFAGARLLATVVFFAGAALALPARAFLGTEGFFAGGALLAVFALATTLEAALEAGLLEALEAGLIEVLEAGLF